jgi:hypothetical protein
LHGVAKQDEFGILVMRAALRQHLRPGTLGCVEDKRNEFDEPFFFRRTLHRTRFDHFTARHQAEEVALEDQAEEHQDDDTADTEAA